MRGIYFSHIMHLLSNIHRFLSFLFINLPFPKQCSKLLRYIHVIHKAENGALLGRLTAKVKVVSPNGPVNYITAITELH